mmetsp:Transcript_18555/g.47527  ORF Transcript_18555/g.47527 Transcript_18555/m.47527 type:complete len:410 (-) Transcript_18555:79-1308(-)
MSDEGVKAIQPFMQRADEVSSADPKVAYYCRLHAVEEGIRYPQRSPALMAEVKSLMSQLELDKPKIDLSDKKADHDHCEAFAVNVFNRADKVDRAGKANLSTARAFYAASLFLDVLNHFGPIDADLATKQKYAVWKATDIRKALKEGRQPTAGSPADVKIFFRPGAKILFAAEPTDSPAQGTVAKVEVIGGEPLYTVALKDTFVQAPMSCLALETNVGEKVSYVVGDTEFSATVQSMELQHWPPSYVIQLEDGTVKDTGPDRICQPPLPPSTVPAPPESTIPPPPPVPSPSTSQPPAQSKSAASPPTKPAPPPPAFYPPPPPPNTQAPAPHPPSAAATASGGAPPPLPPAALPQSPGTAGFKPDGHRIGAAKKLAKSAASSLDFDDVATSIKLLTEALSLLTNPNHKVK